MFLYFLFSNCSEIVQALIKLKIACKTEIDARFGNRKEGIVYHSKYLDPNIQLTFKSLKELFLILEQDNKFNSSSFYERMIQNLDVIQLNELIFHNQNPNAVYYEFWIFKTQSLHSNLKNSSLPFKNFIKNYLNFYEPMNLRILFFTKENLKPDDSIIFDSNILSQIINAFENTNQLISDYRRTFFVKHYNLDNKYDCNDLTFDVREKNNKGENYLKMESFFDKFDYKNNFFCIIDDFTRSVDDLYIYIRKYLLQYYYKPINNIIFFAFKDYYNFMKDDNNREKFAHYWRSSLIIWQNYITNKSDFSISCNEIQKIKCRNINNTSENILISKNFISDPFFMFKADKELLNWSQYSFNLQFDDSEIRVFDKLSEKTTLEEEIYTIFVDLNTVKDFKIIKINCKSKHINYCNLTLLYWNKSVEDNAYKRYFFILGDIGVDKKQKIIAAYSNDINNDFNEKTSNLKELYDLKIFQNIKNYCIDFIQNKNVFYNTDYILKSESLRKTSIKHRLGSLFSQNFSFYNFFKKFICNLTLKEHFDGNIIFLNCYIDQSRINKIKTIDNFLCFNNDNDVSDDNSSSSENNEKIKKGKNEISPKHPHGCIDTQKVLIRHHINRDDDHSSFNQMNFDQKSIAFLGEINYDDKKKFNISNCSDVCIVIKRKNENEDIKIYIPIFENFLKFSKLSLSDIKTVIFEYIKNKIASSNYNELQNKLFCIYNNFFEKAVDDETRRVLVSPDFFFEVAYSHIKIDLLKHVTSYFKKKDGLAILHFDDKDCKNYVLDSLIGDRFIFFSIFLEYFFDKENLNLFVESTKEFVKLIQEKTKEFYNGKIDNQRESLILYCKNYEDKKILELKRRNNFLNFKCCLS